MDDGLQPVHHEAVQPFAVPGDVVSRAADIRDASGDEAQESGDEGHVDLRRDAATRRHGRDLRGGDDFAMTTSASGSASWTRPTGDAEADKAVRPEQPVVRARRMC